ncbi:DUF3307 domain-containing protein [Mangrovicoccus ximenensis]|uniref:DUF3307 domain-containing protein n=1 Tax=Mangrovicoccus ximenensis TaxID=1911570 RepID=UPI000D3A5A35|nr:DUF3307 domain-containing protein [Mangrovicoccus ximenensis]
MLETAAALLLAHVLADYAFQTDWIVENKRRFSVLALHGAIVFAASWLALGLAPAALPLVAVLTLLHMATDAAKTRLEPGRLWSYLADQALHVAAIFLLSALFAAGWSDGLWARLLPAGTPAVLASSVGMRRSGWPMPGTRRAAPPAAPVPRS